MAERMTRIYPAVRSSEGRDMEGSFGTGRPNAARKVSLHDSSPLPDETLLEVAETAQAVNKGGTVRNRPLLTKVSKGLFYFAKPVMQNLTTLFVSLSFEVHLNV